MYFIYSAAFSASFIILSFIKIRMKSVFNPLNAELNPICHLLVLLGDLTFMGPCIVSIFQYISSKMQRYTVYLYLETALHVLGGTSTHHQEHIQIAVTVWQIPDAVDTAVYAPDDGWKYHPKHVEQFPDINKLCNVASCWIYEYIGIPLGVHYILHISRIRVNLVHYCKVTPHPADNGL